MNIIPISVKNSSWVLDELMKTNILISSEICSDWLPFNMFGSWSMFTYLLKMKYVIMNKTLKMEKHTPVISLAFILSFYLFWNKSQTKAKGITKNKFKSISKNMIFQRKFDVLKFTSRIKNAHLLIIMDFPDVLEEHYKHEYTKSKCARKDV